MPARTNITLRQIPLEVREEFTVLFHSFNDLEKTLEEMEVKRKEIIKQAVKDIDQERDRLKSKMDRLKKAMEALFPTEIEAYDINGAWKEKILWVLKTTNSLIPVSTIIGKIRMNENNFSEGLAPTLRLTIRRMAGKGDIVEYENPNLSGKYYGLPDWFDEEANLKEGYYF